MAAANILYMLGRWEEASELIGPHPTTPEDLGLAGMIAVQLKQIKEARAIASRLEADRRPYQLGAPQLAQARIAALLGDTAMALARAADRLQGRPRVRSLDPSNA